MFWDKIKANIMTKMPTLFIPHGGGPCFFMDSNPAHLWDKMEAYLRGCISNLPQKPTAILIISGHWEEEVITIQSNPAPPMLFDYYGFPQHTYELNFPASGSAKLVSRLVELLNQNDIPNKLDNQRGFDHGTFVPLLVALPNADIPVVQLSLRADLNAQAHIKLGEALQPLRDEGILIIGSGMSYHNLPKMLAQMRNPTPAIKLNHEAQNFDTWLTATATDVDSTNRNKKLCDWKNAPNAIQAHPREEHLLPLHVAVGAAGDSIGKQVFNDSLLGTAISAYQFG